MKSKMPLFYTMFAVAFAGLGAAYADSQVPPSAAEIASAEATADLMTNTVVAALLQEISETTPQNVAEGSRSISLVFNDHNHDMRLVGAIDPLRANDYPEDDFEQDALDDALMGAPASTVERVQGEWYYRRSIPLSNFAPECAMCHPTFANLPNTQWVGALMLRIPIEEE